MQRSTITALVLALSFATPAFADPRDSRDEIHIAVTSADLQSDQSVGALYQRIAQAAGNICSQGISAYPMTQNSCRATVLNDAITRANIAELTAYHRHSHVEAQVASR